MVVLDREKGRTERTRRRGKMAISRVRVGLGKRGGIKGGDQARCLV
jgi:hypothetical protein